MVGCIVGAGVVGGSVGDGVIVGELVPAVLSLQTHGNPADAKLYCRCRRCRRRRIII